MDTQSVSPALVHVISDAKAGVLEQIANILHCQGKSCMTWINGEITITLKDGIVLVVKGDKLVVRER